MEYIRAPTNGTPIASRRYGRQTVNCTDSRDFCSVEYLRVCLWENRDGHWLLLNGRRSNDLAKGAPRPGAAMVGSKLFGHGNELWQD